MRCGGLKGLVIQARWPHQDFVRNQDIGNFKLMSRSRMKLRIRETTDDTGYRARQLLKISHSLPLMDGLSAYVGDEILFYRNQNSFGK
jgi:hypothetical protein